VDRGKNAVTHWQVRARAAAVALVECRLQTGRTHQIRVHFADHGHPVVGDATYGGVRKIRGEVGQWLATLSHQALHAWKLSFTHPITGEAMHFEVPPPADVDTILKSLFGDDWIQRPPDARP
jgi:23S rRNA pseudouridine1911/1915/1917 synthase